VVAPSTEDELEETVIAAQSAGPRIPAPIGSHRRGGAATRRGPGGHTDGAAPIGYRRSCRAITMRWTWLVPS
jgi:hypothetical protein